jgi:ABC-type bacteriocin/lantibiotic exporter with double-glycine peptidase domain
MHASVLLRGLWRHISSQRRKQFLGLLILMIVASAAETISIGVVVPFLGVLTSPDRIFDNQILQPWFNYLGLKYPNELLLPFSIGFCVAALAAALIRILLLWATTRLSFATGADLSSSIYRKTLYQPYAVHIARNSSEVIDAITNKTTSVIFSGILPVVQVVSSCIMLLMILALFLWINAAVALSAIGSFGILYFVIAQIARARLLADGENVAKESSKVIKSLQEGLSAIRDVIIDRAQPIYLKIYRESDLSLRLAQGNNVFISQAPRFGIEALGMILIILIAYKLTMHNGIYESIPLLGALALGAQRGLPLLQLAYGAWTSFKGAQASLRDALTMLEQEAPDQDTVHFAPPLIFENKIHFDNVSFRYSASSKLVINELDLTIRKGQRIGLIGASGSGKSTFLDLLMGLMTVNSGEIYIDTVVLNRASIGAWQACIAHVPQNIYLADTSVAENIAFGIPFEDIDYDRLSLAAHEAQIGAVIESWPDRYQTTLGERGIRISGGQRQRIGIARALYKRAEVIVFDEATSALDSETERAVIEAIQGLGKHLTIIMVAHRLTTLQFCDTIIELEQGQILKTYDYHELIKTQSKNF